MANRLSPTVKCQICYKRFGSLAGHLKKHNYIAKQYKDEFDSPVISSLTRHKIRLALALSYQKKYGRPPKREYKGTGRKHSPEAIEKIRQANIGKKLSDKHRLAISASLMGHKVSDETRQKMSSSAKAIVTDELRKLRSELQSAEKGSAWKGGVSRYLYIGKGKFRLKKIFGDPLRCYFPECGAVEGETVKSLDCHHLDGNHENNPLDGSNWLPLCRKHHMLVDGRLAGSTEEEVEKARALAFKAHENHLKKHKVEEVKFYH